MSTTIINQVIDKKTGELLDTKTTSYTAKYIKEPDFIKLYTADIGKLQGISSRGEVDILYELIKLIDYDNQIQMTSYKKKQIADKLGCSLKLIEKAIGTFVKKDVMKRIDRGVFVANPMLFGKGEWKDILKLRVTIDYSDKGRKVNLEKTYKEDVANEPQVVYHTTYK